MNDDARSEAVLAMVIASMSRDELQDQFVRALRKLDRPSAHGVLDWLRNHGPHKDRWNEERPEDWNNVADVLDALDAIAKLEDGK